MKFSCTFKDATDVWSIWCGGKSAEWKVLKSWMNHSELIVIEAIDESISANSPVFLASSGSMDACLSGCALNARLRGTEWLKFLVIFMHFIYIYCEQNRFSVRAAHRQDTLGSYYNTARVKASSLFWNNFAYKGARLLDYSFRLFQQLYSHCPEKLPQRCPWVPGPPFFPWEGKTVKIKETLPSKWPLLTSMVQSQCCNVLSIGKLVKRV